MEQIGFEMLDAESCFLYELWFDLGDSYDSVYIKAPNDPAANARAAELAEELGLGEYRVVAREVVVVKAALELRDAVSHFGPRAT